MVKEVLEMVLKRVILCSHRVKVANFADDQVITASCLWAPTADEETE